MPEYAKCGADALQSRLDAARPGDTVTVTGDWEIEKTVLLPPFVTLVLDGCRLRMAKGTFCPMFANRGAFSFGERTLAKADREIRLVGKNGAELDGGEYNGLGERNAKYSPYLMTANNLVLFSNVDGFEIAGLRCRNQRWWALNFYACRNGRVGEIDFAADCRRYDEGGNLVSGLTHTAPYDRIYIKNADGVDLRLGCHHITVEHITGFTEDDTVALTALHGGGEAAFGVSDEEQSIHDITVRDVRASAFCTIVRLLSQDETRMYNVTVDGVTDTSAESPCLDRGLYAVRVGDAHRYGGGKDIPPENIAIRHVCGRGQAVLQLVGDTSGIRVEDIAAFGGCETVVDRG